MIRNLPGTAERIAAKLDATSGWGEEAHFCWTRADYSIATVHIVGNRITATSHKAGRSSTSQVDAATFEAAHAAVTSTMEAEAIS